MHKAMEIADSNRETLREEVQAIRERTIKRKQKYQAAGLKVLYSYTRRSRGTAVGIDVTSGPAGYAVRINGFISVQSRSLQECVKKGYEKCLIGYRDYISLAYGKENANAY
jgi:hypothetical protein